MTFTITFDTLDYAKKLEAEGVPIGQAEAQSKYLKEVLEANLMPMITQQQEAQKETTSLSAKMDSGFAEIKNEIRILNAAIESTNKRIDDKANLISSIAGLIAIFVGIHSFFPNFHF